MWDLERKMVVRFAPGLHITVCLRIDTPRLIAQSLELAIARMFIGI
jgi:hypothetical protein